MKSPLGVATAVALSLSATTLDAQVLNTQSLTLENFQSTLPLRDNDATTGQPGNFEYIAMFPAEDHAAWGFDPSQPGMHRIDGVRVLLGDTDGSTANAFNIWVHTENPAAPGQPDVANSVGFGVNSPVAGAGPQAFLYDIVLPVPEYVPAGADVFISIEFLPESTADSLSILTLGSDDASAIGATIWDIGNGRTSETGHGSAPTGGYGYLVDWSSATMFFELGQYAVAPLAAQATFATAATTNQASLPTSNPGATPGWSPGLFSARQPSLVNDRTGNARSDDIALFYENDNLAAGDVVGFFFGFGFAANPVDLNLLVSGSTGTFCLDLSAVVDLGVQLLDAENQAVLPIPLGDAAQRAGLLGLDFVFSAIAVDFAADAAHAGGCGIVRF